MPPRDLPPSVRRRAAQHVARAESRRRAPPRAEHRDRHVRCWADRSGTRTAGRHSDDSPQPGGGFRAGRNRAVQCGEFPAPAARDHRSGHRVRPSGGTPATAAHDLRLLRRRAHGPARGRRAQPGDRRPGGVRHLGIGGVFPSLRPHLRLLDPRGLRLRRPDLHLPVRAAGPDRPHRRHARHRRSPPDLLLRRFRSAGADIRHLHADRREAAGRSGCVLCFLGAAAHGCAAAASRAAGVRDRDRHRAAKGRGRPDRTLRRSGCGPEQGGATVSAGMPSWSTTSC